MNKKEIILKILLNRKCKRSQKKDIVTYNLKSLKVFVPVSFSKKIEVFIKQKKYRLLSLFIDNYKERFLLNV